MSCTHPTAHPGKDLDVGGCASPLPSNSWAISQFFFLPEEPWLSTPRCQFYLIYQCLIWIYNEFILIKLFFADAFSQMNTDKQEQSMSLDLRQELLSFSSYIASKQKQK